MNDTRPPAQDWIDALDLAEADVAAGRVVHGAELQRELKEFPGFLPQSTEVNHRVQGPQNWREPWAEASAPRRQRMKCCGMWT